MLLINKSDLLTAYQRDAWARYFRSKDVAFVFYSAHNELEQAEKLKSTDIDEPLLEDEMVISIAEAIVKSWTKRTYDNSMEKPIPSKEVSDEAGAGVYKFAFNQM
jgi:ribosome biogenesis GTPase A